MTCLECGHSEECNCGDRVYRAGVVSIRCCGEDDHVINPALALEKIWKIATYLESPEKDGEPVDRLEAIQDLCLKTLPVSFRGKP